jgi:hypothetical protein
MEAAKQILEEKGYTCVLKKGDIIHTATERGVKPLVRWLTEGIDVRGFSAADKVVGKATAYLYVLLGVKEVYAHIMSASAAEVLARQGITAAQGKLVENIINRQGTGICPFEAAVLDIHTPEEALTAIREKMLEMNITL